ncbi:hypothetical protein SprV_0200989700 [Sparganum proliferum]
MAVLIGAHNHTRKDGPAYNVRVKHAIIHPEFPVNGPKVGFDVALLKLDRDVKRSTHVAFPCLPDSGYQFPTGHRCHVVGWGLIADPPNKPLQQQPEVLMEKPAIVAKTSDCKKVFPPFRPNAHVCTEQTSGTSCLGDSGGGLHCLAKDGRWTVYGVASFAPPDCAGKYYVAASIDSALTWIKDTITTAN